MTNPRVSPGVTVINDEIWVIGGASQRDGRLQAIPDVEVFDPVKLGWISAVPLNEAKFGVTPVLINGEIWSVGGYDGTNKSSMQTELFSFREHQWSIQRYRLKSIPGAAAGAQIPSTVFSFGGRDADGRALSMGQIFNPHSGTLERSQAPKTADSKKPAAEPAPIPQEKAHFEPGAPVARPPVPQGVDPKTQVIYGVAFDLETLKPVADATIVLLSLPTRVGVKVKTDARGWYRYAFRKGDLPDVDFAVISNVFKTEPLRERNPALASLSPEVRQFFANDPPADASTRTRIPAALPFVEVDLALVPKEWPASISQPHPQEVKAPPASRPKPSEGRDPPVPARPLDVTHCFVYGLFYDALTGRAVGRAHFVVSADSPVGGRYRGQFMSDDNGHYLMDLALQDLATGLWATAQANGLDVGISADADPPLRKRPKSERRQAAGQLEFERAKLPDDEVCRSGVVRFDLVTMLLKSH